MRRGAALLALSLAGAALLSTLAATQAAAQVGGTILRMEPPRVPGLSIPAGAFGVSGPWDPLGLLGAPSPTGPSALTPAAAAARASDIIVVPALFSDSPEPHVPAAEIQRILFDGPSEGGTFAEFYEEASRGRISPDGEVAPWVRTDVTLLEASGDFNGHGQITGQTATYIAQAVERADPSVDFGLFDDDGPDGVPNSGDDDGFVDALVIEFLEIAGSCGGPAIWPHFSALFETLETGERIRGVPTDDLRPDGTPIRAHTYLTQSVTDCGGVNPQGPNVIAHEYGHQLGLPDLYQAVEGLEPEKRHWNIGCFGLMGAGSWGCGTGIKAESFGPVHLSAFSKLVLGWMEEEPVHDVLEREYVLEPAQTTGRALRIPLDDTGQESLYVEYRPQIGFDHWLPAGGVLIYHRDTNARGRNVPPHLPPAKSLHLVEADGDHALRKVERLGGNRGVAEDVFGIGGRTGPYSSDSGPVRLLRHEGQPVPVIIHSIEVEDGPDGGLARLVISASRVPTLMASEPAAGLRALQEGPLAELRLAGGALPYTVTDADPQADFDVVMSGTEGVLTGTVLGVGTVDVELRIEDALGTVSTAVVTLEVEDADIDPAALVDAVVSMPGSDPEAAGYLDAQGNGNGRADVGDLRAWLRRTGRLR